MAYTNTWQISAPVSSDDWTDMDNALTDLKTDIVERVWEDGLHLENIASIPSLSEGQVLISTANAAGQTLLTKSGSEHPLSLVDSGEIYPGIIGSFPDVIPLCGGFIDSDGVMKASTCEMVTVTTPRPSYAPAVLVTLDETITDLRSGYLGFACFWDDGSAYICKRVSGSGSVYFYSLVANASGEDVLAFFTNISLERDYSVSVRAAI